MAKNKLINIVGIKVSDKGHSCEEHACCGDVLELDSLVRIKEVQFRRVLGY